MRLIDLSQLYFGAVIAIADLVEVKTYNDVTFNREERLHLNPKLTAGEFEMLTEMHKECCGLVFENIEPVDSPYLCRGYLGFFEVGI